MRIEDMRVPFMVRHEDAIIEIKILAVVVALFAATAYGSSITAFLSRLF